MLIKQLVDITGTKFILQIILYEVNKICLPYTDVSLGIVVVLDLELVLAVVAVVVVGITFLAVVVDTYVSLVVEGAFGSIVVEAVK